MAERTSTRTHWCVGLSALALFYAAVAVTLATQDYLLQPWRGSGAVPWLAYVGGRITQWLVWTGWTPFVSWLGRRFRLDREPRVRHWAIHVAALVVMVCSMPKTRTGSEEERERLATALRWAREGAERLRRLVDDDTLAYDSVVAAYRLPKASESAGSRRNSSNMPLRGAAAPLATSSAASAPNCRSTASHKIVCSKT